MPYSDNISVHSCSTAQKVFHFHWFAFADKVGPTRGLVVLSMLRCLFLKQLIIGMQLAKDVGVRIIILVYRKKSILFV